MFFKDVSSFIYQWIRWNMSSFFFSWLEKNFFWMKELQKKKPGCNVFCENSGFLKYHLNIIVLVCGKIEMIFSFM